jgi:hypothetical protein
VATLAAIQNKRKIVQCLELLAEEFQRANENSRITFEN